MTWPPILSQLGAHHLCWTLCTHTSWTTFHMHWNWRTSGNYWRKWSTLIGSKPTVRTDCAIIRALTYIIPSNHGTDECWFTGGLQPSAIMEFVEFVDITWAHYGDAAFGFACYAIIWSASWQLTHFRFHQLVFSANKPCKHKCFDQMVSRGNLVRLLAAQCSLFVFSIIAHETPTAVSIILV